MLNTNNNEHKWHFFQAGGLMQVQFSTIDDVLNIDKLDPKLWTALACPVKGLEFSEETLALLDTDKNGRVRVPEIIAGVAYIKKYFSKPEIIMTPGDSIPLDALSDTPFDCGHSPLASAKSVLEILGKPDATEISLSDVSVNEKLFSPGVVNGDGVLPAECVKEANVASVIKDIVTCTGGSTDISGVTGTNRQQFVDFFNLLRSIKEWREDAVLNDPKIFFLKEATDSAATAFMKIKDKINEYFLRCSIINYDDGAEEIFKNQTEKMFLDEEGQLCCREKLLELPLALGSANQPLPLDNNINPAWAEEMTAFKKYVIQPIFQKDITALTEAHWRKIEAFFEPYVNWVKAMPQNVVSQLGLDRITEILNSDAEEKIAAYLDEEEKHPPIALATVDLRKMLLYRRDFVYLLHNFISFDDFYSLNKTAIFQCGTLYIDGRSCDLCFKVLDMAKHGVMAALSQCYLIYCDCTKVGTNEKMQIAAVISNGNTDNLIIGRNGLFFDRDGADWDATIVKIIDNPVSLRQAFWSPYKKLIRMIQERIAKTASAAEASVIDKMSKTVESPKTALPQKKTDIGTVAAISVAFTGIATVLGGILDAFLGLGYWIPLGILGIMLCISLPSVFIAWSKLRQRNIAPILDASGWAINGNVKITTLLGTSLTDLPSRPAGAYFTPFDKFSSRKANIAKIVLWTLLVLLIALLIFLHFKHPGFLTACWQKIKTWFSLHGPKLNVPSLKE